MQWLIFSMLSVHVLASVFWAGTTFALARTRGAAAVQLFRPQMAAAAIAVLTGAYLWYALHEGSAGTPEYLLGFAATCAIIAWIVQLTTVRPGTDGGGTGRPPNTATTRLAALLLAVAAIGMAAARYA